MLLLKLSSFFVGNKIARIKLLWLPNGIIPNDLISGWNFDPCDHQVIGPRLMGMDSYKIKSESDFIIHFSPLTLSKVKSNPFFQQVS